MKRQTQHPIDQYLPVSDAEKKKKKKKLAEDNLPYEVEIVAIDKQEKKVKEGFSEKADEGRDCVIAEAPLAQELSLGDRINSFHERVYYEIKRKLWSGLRDDPSVRIEIIVDVDVFEKGLGQVVRGIQSKGKKIYAIKDNNSLDHLLGLKWSERVFNENGDFAYVVKGTVKFWLAKRNPITEFKYIDGKLVRSAIQGLYMLVFTFVRGDGNKRQYISGNF